MVGAHDHTHKHANQHRATGLARNLPIIENAVESTVGLAAITNTISHSLVRALAQRQHKTKNPETRVATGSEKRLYKFCWI